MTPNNNKFDLLYNHVVKNKNINFDYKFDYNNKKVCYICQNGTSGYATAAKGYIYDLILKKIPLNIIYFNCNDEVKDDDNFHRYINSNNNNQSLIPNTVIIHSTPDIWQGIIETAPYKKSSDSIIIGRTVWEFEKLLPEWVNCINNTQVDFVSVPTEWNKDSFIKSGVKKPIIVEPHIYVDYPYKNLGLNNLFRKSILLSKTEENFQFENYYKFCCIGQIIDRKGVLDTLEAFCRSFNSSDKVILILKTFNKNYSDEESSKCLNKIRNIISNYDHAPILFINKQLNYDEIHTIHDVSDCYVQLTKSEGFGLGIFDAFNKNKKIIVTGYGGHTSYLGKKYKNYVQYKLKNLNVDEEVFFQFKLDETYSWAIPDKNHAVELMKNAYLHFCVNNKINIGEGFFETETEDDNLEFKWTTEKCELYINDVKIKNIKLELFNLILDNYIYINETNKKYILQKGHQILDIEVENCNKIVLKSGYFVPSKSISSSDNRKLSYKIYSIEIEDESGLKQKIPFCDLKHINDVNHNTVTFEFRKKIDISITNQKPNVEILDFNYDKSNFYFNSCIFKLHDEKYIMTRFCNLQEKTIDGNNTYEFNNSLKLFTLDNLKDLNLNIINEVEDEQYEDPRVLVHDNKIYVGCANYQLNNVNYIHQKILVFDDKFNHIHNIHPVYDGNEKNCFDNTKHQKNWTYFIKDSKLMCVYKMYPHTVLEIDFDGTIVSEYISHNNITKTWKFGECRMGTNPILKDGYYHNFFHSSISWRNPKRQYVMGYYKFESEPPFKIVEISREPILWGNESDFRFLPKQNPIVVFPCGVIYENNQFHISFGLNDEKTGIIKI